MAANIFTGVVDANWGTAGNWSLVLVPTASDGHVATFNGTSPACTVNTSARVCNTLDFTGYTNTITMSQQITVSGNITLASGMTIAGSGALLCNATATLTSAGKTWPNALTFNGASLTITLSDNWDVDGLMSCATGNTSITINGFQITCSAGLTSPQSSTVTNGTTNFILDGTGTVTLPTSVASFRNNLTINTAGTITFAAAVNAYSHGTLTYTAGTVVTTGSTLQISGGATTLAVNGITWNAVTLAGAFTHTLTNNLSLTGVLTLGATTGDTIINGSTINASGGITFAATSGSCYGTTILNVNATSTLSAPSITVGEGIDMPIVLNAPGGTITVSAGFRVNLAKISYTAGTVIAGNTWATSGGGISRHVNGGLIRGQVL